jgi:hypothetical protein
MPVSLGKTIGVDTLKLRARVASKVRHDPATGCALWTGALSENNRGQRPVIQVGDRGSRVVLVARRVLEWSEGPPLTPAHEAGRTCPCGEHSWCVEPTHVRWMTRTENEQQRRTDGILDYVRNGY